MSIQVSKQTTFDQFLTVKNKKRTYFYVDWSKYPYNPVWLTDRPSKVNYEVEIKWRELGWVITICCYNEDSIYEKPEETQYNNVSLMKSHLQKCIRRQLTNKAVSTAWHLIKMDFNSFIRRLPIIMLEDVRLHYSFSVLIWLMVATSKGYCLTKNQIEWILGVVSYMCIENQYDNFEQNCENIKNIPVMIKKVETLKQLIPCQRDFLYSLLLRVSYGGMKGDMNMIYSFAESWTRKFINGDDIDNKIIVPISIVNINNLDIDDIERNCADFHCFPQILEMIHDKFKNYSIDNIRQCLWEYNSKYNCRKHNDQIINNQYLFSIWLQIQLVTQSLQDQLIISNH